MRPNLTIETFREDELDAVAQVLRSAFRTERDYHPILRQHLYLQPEGALMARLEDRIVGFGAATIYGPFSYIALMATHPDEQRRGIARMILDRLVAWIEARGCPTILLDASVFGEHLYQTSGFTAIDTTLVLRRDSVTDPGGGTGAYPTRSDVGLSALTAFDSPIFGADRSRFLAYLMSDIPERILVSYDRSGMVDGYLVAQRTQCLGPWVASSAVAAETLLSRALREIHFETAPEVFVSGSNASALAILDRYGFREQRRLHHMYRGESIRRERATKIYGQASLGQG